MKIEDFNINLSLDSVMPDEEIIPMRGGSNLTSEKYKKEAKKFLGKNMIYSFDNIKKSTYRYIGDRNNIPLPVMGEQIRIRTQQQMNLIVIILKLVDMNGGIDELTIATYTLNREAMSILTQLKETAKIERINLLIASSYGFRDPKWKAEIEKLCKQYQIHLTFAWSHFKITLAKCGSNYYQLEGSMNYSTNNMAEQIIFENSKEIYEKDYEFINTAMTDTNNKALEVIC